MIIGIDASKTAKENKTGIDNVAYQIILNLAKIDKKNTYYLYTNKAIDPKLKKNPNFIEKLIPFPKFWTRFRLPLALLRDKPDIFLALTSGIPPLAPKKTAVLIHDLASKFFPEAYSSKEKFLQEAAIQTALKKAAKIIFTSDANKNDFLKYYKYPENKISTIPIAYDKNLFRDSKIKDILHLKDPYFLFVGRLEARKNVVNIVKAFQLFKHKYNTSHKLVLVGKPGEKYRDISKQIEEDKEIKKDIVMPGFIKSEDLVHLYAGAEALVYPSLYEGFGIPILESFATGTPVISSEIPTIKYVTENAAILVDPKKPENIAEALYEISSDSNLKKELINKGFKRAQDFDWESTAKSYKKLFEEL